MRKTCNSFLLTSQFLHVSQVLNFFGFYMNSLKKSNSVCRWPLGWCLVLKKGAQKIWWPRDETLVCAKKKWLKLKTIGPYLAVSSNIETVTIWHTKNRHLNFLWWSAFQVPTTIWRQISQETCVILGYGKSYPLPLDQTLETQKIRN